MNGSLTFPTEYNVVSVNGTSSDWAMRKHESLSYEPIPSSCCVLGTITLLQVLRRILLTHISVVIQDSTGFGLFHPIHLHGHDFWVVAQDAGTFDPATTNITTTNPPRRDVATLPGNGVSNSPADSTHISHGKQSLTNGITVPRHSLQAG